MTTLILGGNGQLGWELKSTMQGFGDLIAWDRSNYGDLGAGSTDDGTFLAGVQAVMGRSNGPHVLVNALAFTDVDKAESIEYSGKASLLNTRLPMRLSILAKQMGFLFIHYSTDMVFDGSAGKHYPFREDTPTSPVNFYGETKLQGEMHILKSESWSRVLRTSWLYSARRRNFLRSVVTQSLRNDVGCRVVDDQIGCPTWARWLALATAHIVRSELTDSYKSPLIYHVSNSNETSKFEFAKEICRLLNLPAPQPISSSVIVSSAKRPAYSALSCERLHSDYGLIAPPWQQSLRIFLEEFNSAAELSYDDIVSVK